MRRFFATETGIIVLTRITYSKYYNRIRNSDIFVTLIHSQNYFLAKMITNGLTFLSIPIFTRLFTQEDYGIVSVYRAFVGIFVVLLSANIYSSVSRYYYENKPDFDEFLGTSLILTFLMFFINTLLFLIFYPLLKDFMNLPEFLPLLIIFSSLFMILYNMYFQLIQAQRRSLESAVISITYGILSLGSAVLFVILLEENRYMGQIWSLLLVGLVFSIYFLNKILSKSKIGINIHHVKYIIFYSTPLILYALSSQILAFFDRIMINNMIDSASAGVYSLGYNIAIIVGIVITVTQAALLPDFYSFLNQKQYARLDALISKVFSIITVAVLGMILFAREIVFLLVDEKFHEGLTIIPLIVIGYIFFGMFSVYGRYISYAKKTIYSSLVMIISGLINIILNVILIPKYGIIAAAFSTIVSYFVLFCLTWFVTKFILKQKVTSLWVIWKPTLILFGFIAIFGITIPLITNILLVIILKVAFLIVYCLITFHKELKILLTS